MPELRTAANTEYVEEYRCNRCDTVLLEEKTVATGDKMYCDDCGIEYTWLWTGVNVKDIVQSDDSRV